MALEVEAVYENGVLKPVRELPLAEGQRVRVAIEIIGERIPRPGGLIHWPPQFPLDAFENGGAYDLEEEPSDQ